MLSKKTLSERILEYSTLRPEGAFLCVKEVVHFGNRSAVNQALARLVRRGKLYGQLAACMFGRLRDVSVSAHLHPKGLWRNWPSCVERQSCRPELLPPMP